MSVNINFQINLQINNVSQFESVISSAQRIVRYFSDKCCKGNQGYNGVMHILQLAHTNGEFYVQCGMRHAQKIAANCLY